MFICLLFSVQSQVLLRTLPYSDTRMLTLSTPAPTYSYRLSQSDGGIKDRGKAMGIILTCLAKAQCTDSNMKLAGRKSEFPTCPQRRKFYISTTFPPEDRAGFPNISTTFQPEDRVGFPNISATFQPEDRAGFPNCRSGIS